MMTKQRLRTIIVGGVAGGMSTATRLRRRDENMEIIVFEASGYVSYANCGLPYQLGGTIKDRDALLLQTPQSLTQRFDIDVRVNHRVTAIHPEHKYITVSGPDGTEEFTYDFLVLSPGARPIIPNLPGIERALTLRTVEDLDALTTKVTETTNGNIENKTAAIIGGGFIGVELAENLHHRGFKVTIIEQAPHILGVLDQEMAGIVTDHLRNNGISVITNNSVTEIGNQDVVLTDGTTVAADLVVAAIGVSPDSSLATAAGLEVDERGGILTDDNFRTSAPDVFAIGDAAAKRDFNDNSATLIPLAQTANRHGRMVADIITGRDTRRQSTQGTSIIGVLGLAAATTGWSERRARQKGKNIRIVHVHPSDHAGYYPGATQLHIKLVIDAKTDQLLGAQVVGKNGVDKRIDVIATAMRAGMTASDLADLELAYAPQFGSAKDAVNIAGMVADNRRTTETALQWHEIAMTDLPLIDVRTPSEFAQGTIPGAVNIPVDELRERQAEIPETAVLFCQVGLRGHIAHSLLTQLNKKVSNLDGGYLTWHHSRLV